MKLQFDNRFVAELPADPEATNQRRQVSKACYSRVQPKEVANPRLVAYSQEMAESLGLSERDCESEQFAQVFSGNELLPGMDPYATCYGGHQFGNWAGQLGDGRAINLGEVLNASGERWALQLKGAGLTPYSRTADGLAVLRSSLREYICSEAMHHLGVPTTRALSLITTGEEVLRDMFYDGRPAHEPGAVVCRVAPSFTRFGSFQIFAWREEFDELKQLLDYTLRYDFPELLPEGQSPNPDIYAQWFAEVCRRTAEMILHWMRVGFVHGVMNTDNMSVLGLTIDYGPYGWLEDFDPNWTPNTTDSQERRYRYGQQPQIALWNLQQLAAAIHPVVKDVEALKQGLSEYASVYNDGWSQMMADKLGLLSLADEGGESFINELQIILKLVETDMTLFYRCLPKFGYEQNFDQLSNEILVHLFHPSYYEPEQIRPDYIERLRAWLAEYNQRLQAEGRNGNERKTAMDQVNPLYVPRNYLAQLAIDKAEQGDNSLLLEWQQVLKSPYAEQPGKDKFAEKRPEWARLRAGCSMLSCSS